jgi:RNA polymerase sigma factor (sigma-70 family)
MKSPNPHQQFIESALRQYEGPLLAYAYSILQDLELARDVVQDTFIKLYEQDTHEWQTGLKAWLYTVCRNRSIDIIRKERRLVALDDAWADMRADEATPDPREAAAQRETHAEIAQLIEKLPTQQREVIRLKFQADLSYKEISDITGYSATNVGFILHTALKRLRHLMQRSQPEAERGSTPSTTSSPRPTGKNLRPTHP